MVLDSSETAPSGGPADDHGKVGPHVPAGPAQARYRTTGEVTFEVRGSQCLTSPRRQDGDRPRRRTDFAGNVLVRCFGDLGPPEHVAEMRGERFVGGADNLGLVECRQRIGRSEADVVSMIVLDVVGELASGVPIDVCALMTDAGDEVRNEVVDGTLAALDRRQHGREYFGDGVIGVLVVRQPTACVATGGVDVALVQLGVGRAIAAAYPLDERPVIRRRRARSKRSRHGGKLPLSDSR